MDVKQHIFKKRTDILKGIEKLLRNNDYKEIIFLSAIGALEEVELWVANNFAENPDINKVNYRGPFELLSISGNAKIEDDRFHSHVHVSGSLSDCSVKGGSLHKGKIFRGTKGAVITYLVLN